MSIKKREATELEVARYYDSNTGRFLRSRKKRHIGAIHRKLVSPDIPGRVLSEHYSESLILEILKKSGAVRIMDMGCGIGGSIRFLKKHYPADYTGITLSAVQCEIAKNLNIEIETGSYLDISWYKNRKPFDVIYAIESLQHNPDHQLLAHNLKKVMKPGSLLVVIDDFISEEGPFNQRTTKLVNRFRKFWHSPGFIGKSVFVDIMDRQGLILQHETDLSPLMPNPILNHNIRASYLNLLSLLSFQHAALDNIIGGGTLILLQQLGISGYYMLVFERL